MDNKTFMLGVCGNKYIIKVCCDNVIYCYPFYTDEEFYTYAIKLLTAGYVCKGGE